MADGNMLLIKEDSETDPKVGSYPDKRPIEVLLKNGLIILDKPHGPTSHQVASWAKDIFSAKKCGHSGTLDPNVTGVLPLALDNATKAMQFMIGSQKEYICLMKLHTEVDEKQIRESANKFTGKIMQKVPLKSHVKKQIREREIYELEILEIDKSGRSVLFRAKTQAGTYIRKLCDDWGKLLGTKAHMQELRRTEAAGFSEKNAYILQDVKDAFVFWKENGDETELRKIILPVEVAVDKFPKIVTKDSAVGTVCNGGKLFTKGISKLTSDVEKNKFVAIMTLKGELVAIGKSRMSAADIIKDKEGAVAMPDRVIMDQQLYPKMPK